MELVHRSGLSGSFRYSTSACHQFTEEEFSKAFGSFRENGKPLIYTYFKKQPIDPDLIDQSLLDFKKTLTELGHFRTNYQDINDLKHQFGEQLVKIFPKLSIDL
jgi:hypothetical protein